MILFYCPELEKSKLILPEDESRHISKVLRLNPGDQVRLTNGKGLMAVGEILEIRKQMVKVAVTEHVSVERSRSKHIHIAIAPPKNAERFEWFAEKATEIGIDEITPVYCEHSERKRLRTDRIKRVMIAAMKQSLKAYLPLLNEPVSFAEFVNGYKEADRFIAHCADGHKTELVKIKGNSDHKLVLIGPEGDFSSNEVSLALEHSYIPVSLGNTRLRTETAALVACHILNLLEELG